MRCDVLDMSRYCRYIWMLWMCVKIYSVDIDSVQLLPVSGAGLAGVEGVLEAGLALRPGHQAQVNLPEEWV